MDLRKTSAQMLMEEKKHSILHVTESFTRVGGVETLLSDWIDIDLSTAGMALLDVTESESRKARRFGLRRSKFDSLCAIRGRVQKMRLACGTLMLHNFAGFRALTGLIQHERLIVYLHSNSSDILSLIKHRAQYVDGYIASSRNLAEQTHILCRDFPVATTALNYPLGIAYDGASETRERRTNWIIGYAGRLEREQKRVERLKDLCDELKKNNVLYQLQIAGAGSQKKTLLKNLTGYPVVYLGSLEQKELISTYKKWDFHIVTSDYETGPLTIFEGMACGSIPILPMIDCQAKDLMEVGHRQLIYQPGSMADAADRILTVIRLSHENLEGLRKSLRVLAHERGFDGYLKSVHAFINQTQIQTNKRLPIKFDPNWRDRLPFFLSTRIKQEKNLLK